MYEKSEDAAETLDVRKIGNQIARFICVVCYSRGGGGEDGCIDGSQSSDSDCFVGGGGADVGKLSGVTISAMVDTCVPHSRGVGHCTCTRLCRSAPAVGSLVSAIVLVCVLIGELICYPRQWSDGHCTFAFATDSLFALQTAFC